ncbi:hypothetical protein HOLleu_33185 [Holothuria leucospilota]|uniref:Uncharacterized protein n=1 Tax=Holothuria leucospilota TaxID=206669 RepID=A0A9Q0YQC6_HOLLE|nr:hypothetical protein HOLleu_33185 [Holothuria leucospilota]
MMYKFLRILHDKNIYKSPWMSRIKSIFEKTGMPFIWNYNYNSIETNWLDKTIGLRLNDIYTQDWISDVNNNSQCKNYRIFKQDLKLEKYLYSKI